MTSVHSKIIGNFAVVIHIEDGDVSKLTNFKGADLFVAAEGIRRIDGRGANSFGWGHAQLGASQRQNHGHAYGWAGAGIIVRGESDDGSCVEQVARGSIVF